MRKGIKREKQYQARDICIAFIERIAFIARIAIILLLWPASAIYIVKEIPCNTNYGKS